MRPRSHTSGRHELGQNFLIHRPTLQRLATLAAATDGAILEIERRVAPLVPDRDRRRFERFVGVVFRSGGNGIRQILRSAGHQPAIVDRALGESGIARAALPRDLSPEHWARLWHVLDEGGRRRGGQ